MSFGFDLHIGIYIVVCVSISVYVYIICISIGRLSLMNHLHHQLLLCCCRRHGRSGDRHDCVRGAAGGGDPLSVSPSQEQAGRWDDRAVQKRGLLSDVTQVLQSGWRKSERVSVSDRTLGSLNVLQDYFVIS